MIRSFKIRWSISCNCCRLGFALKESLSNVQTMDGQGESRTRDDNNNKKK